MSIHVERDCVSIQIDQDFHELKDAPFKPSIFRVHDRLRKENKDAYEPEMLSIGPYHHGKQKLIPMEKHKLQLLKQLISRRGEVNTDRYVWAMRKLEEPTRKCYADPIHHRLDSNKFVKMMILDSCFIIELFRKIQGKKEYEPIFQMDHVLNGILRDLKLLENQLPFFVMIKFMNMSGGQEKEDIIDMSSSFFHVFRDEAAVTVGRRGRGRGRGRGGGGGGGEDIIDMALCAFHYYDSRYQKPDVALKNIKHLLDLLRVCWYSSFTLGMSRAVLDVDWNYIKPATELKEAGIEFKSAKERPPKLKEAGIEFKSAKERSLLNRRTVLNVRFQKGVLELPQEAITPYTEAVARNLIAYEQHLPADEHRYVTDYYVLLDRLVDSSKDVEILRRHGVIQHTLGDDGDVSAMINKVVNQTFPSKVFTYAQVLYDVNKHCRRRWNPWLANLKHKYFNTPWALISVLAAMILLLLTLTQTIFTVLSGLA